jgi:flagellar M-ring protein FliF
VKVSAVDFVDAGLDLQPVPAPTFGEILMRQSGTLINAATILVVAGLLIFFGFRPATRLLLADKNKPVEMLSSDSDPASALALTENFGDNFVMPELTPMSEEQMLASAGEMPQLGADGDQNLIEDLMSKPKRLTQRRLEQMVEFDEEQAAAILKAWVHEGMRG